jgi:DNA-directed RNA polymerase specialized sigma24 family protein
VTDSDWLDGPSLVRWIEETVPRFERKELTESQARRLNGWKNGEAAGVYIVDAILTRLGRTIHELPDELWTDNPRRNTFRKIDPKVKKRAVKLRLEGLRTQEVAAICGVDRRSVDNWTRKARLG